MNKTFFLPLIILFFVLYYFVFPREGGNEGVLAPEAAWTLSSGNFPEDSLLIGRGERKALFFDDGRAPYLTVSGRNGVLTEKYHFYREGRRFLLKNISSGDIYSVDGEGEALILNSRIYLVDLWKGRIQEFDGQGNSLWKWQGLGPVTALAADERGTVLGLLDGSVHLFDENGIQRVIHPDPGRDDCIVYGLALSPGGDRLSVLSGLNEQSLCEYDINSLDVFGEPRVLDSRFRRPVKLVYSQKGDVLWVEQKDKVLQIGPEEASLEIPQEGRLLFLQPMDSDGKLMILTEVFRNGGKRYDMNVYSQEGALVSTTEFNSHPDDIVVKDNRIFFSIGGRILELARRTS